MNQSSIPNAFRTHLRIQILSDTTTSDNAVIDPAKPNISGALVGMASVIEVVLAGRLAIATLSMVVKCEKGLSSVRSFQLEMSLPVSCYQEES